MKISGAFLHPYALPFTCPITTSTATVSMREGLLVELVDTDGQRGFGEAAPWPGWGIFLGQVQACLERLVAPASFIWRTPWSSVDDCERLLLPEAVACPEAAHAIELAVLDLLAQSHAVPLSRLLSATSRDAVLVHALVDDAEGAALAAAQGARHFKIKVGAQPLAADDRRLRAIRDAVGPAAALHIDANGAWDLQRASAALTRWQDLGLTLVEQPLSTRSAMADFVELRRRTDVRLAIDEGMRSPTDIERIIDAQAVDAVVLKPMMVGGVLAARRLAITASAAGLLVSVTSVLETTVGRMGALHLAAALLPEPLVCGFSSRLDADGTLPAPGCTPLAAQRGARGLAMAVPAASGLGVVRSSTTGPAVTMLKGVA